jgi:predicted acylesterase/phospholipase RssA
LKLGPEQAPGPDAQPPLDEDDGLGIISKSIDTMQDRIARHQLAACQPDLLVEVPVDACSMLEFHRADELIALGQRLARRTLRDWRRRQDGTVDDDGPQVTQADNQASDQSTNGVDGETRPPHPTAVGQKGPAQAG